MDIDIDIAPSTKLLEIFPVAVQASNVVNRKLVRHPVGVYFQNVPKDPQTGFAAIPYTHAPNYGFFKFDFLNLHLLDMFTSKAEVRRLASQDPDWNLLRDPDVVGQLFHLSKHFELVDMIAPTSIEELADCMALIRPGKTHLIPLYLRDKVSARKELYAKLENGEYSYKRCQAVAYATLVVLQLHVFGRGNSISTSDMLEWG